MTRRTSRALIALAALVTAGAGAAVVATVATASSPGASSFVPITPCRLLDTRPGSDTVGMRSTPLGAGETLTVDTWGTNGNCTIPSGATGLSLNVVAVGPTANSFLTVFPADVSRPTASSLNWVAGQAPTPNGVTARVGADGRLSFYNLAGTVNLAVDVVGYYEAVGPAVTPGPDPARVVWVAASGGDFTSISAALASITDNDASHPYLVKVAPGTYTENDGIDMKPYVDIEGSGRLTEIRSTSTVGVVRFETAGELRDLSIVGTVGGVGVYALDVPSGVVRLSRVAITMSPQMPTGMYVDSSEVVLDDVVIELSGGISTTALQVQDSSVIELNRVRTYSTSSVANSTCKGLYVLNSTAVVRSSELIADSCLVANYGIDAGTSVVDLSDVTVKGLGGSVVTSGVSAVFGTLRADDVVAQALGGPSATAVSANNASVQMSDSALDSTGVSFEGVSGSMHLSDSTVWGATSGMSGRCTNVRETNMTSYTCV